MALRFTRVVLAGVTGATTMALAVTAVSPADAGAPTSTTTTTTLPSTTTSSTTTTESPTTTTTASMPEPEIDVSATVECRDGTAYLTSVLTATVDVIDVVIEVDDRSFGGSSPEIILSGLSLAAGASTTYEWAVGQGSTHAIGVFANSAVGFLTAGVFVEVPVCSTPPVPTTSVSSGGDTGGSDPPTVTLPATR